MVEEMTREGDGDYESLITRDGRRPSGRPRSVSGTVFADGRPRIVNIKGIRMDAEFGPSMIYITNLDKPGFIGRFSSHAGRRRHQHRDLPCRPRGAGRQCDRADRDRRRAAAGGAGQGAGAAAGAAGEAAEVLIAFRGVSLNDRLMQPLNINPIPPRSPLRLTETELRPFLCAVNACRRKRHAPAIAFIRCHHRPVAAIARPWRPKSKPVRRSTPSPSIRTARRSPA